MPHCFVTIHENATFFFLTIRDIFFVPQEEQPIEVLYEKKNGMIRYRTKQSPTARFLPDPLSDQVLSRQVAGIHDDVRHPSVQGASNLCHSPRNVFSARYEKQRKRSLSSTEGKGCTPDTHGDKNTWNKRTSPGSFPSMESLIIPFSTTRSPGNAPGIEVSLGHNPFRDRPQSLARFTHTSETVNRMKVGVGKGLITIGETSSDTTIPPASARPDVRSKRFSKGRVLR